MPKIKSHRGAAKRFHATGSGRICRNQANHRHILTKKSAKRKRSLLGPSFVAQADVASIRKMLPYL
ncbi:MAG: 50S ribosomal protein L35 [Magnetococcales bacterium]|nr:50S ribosomal protein L35 [Magnetococcales bacterium]